jgi:hypothetical protein
MGLLAKNKYQLITRSEGMGKGCRVEWATLATFDKNIGVISTSESMLLVAAGDKILISRDLGKSFK